MIHDCQALRLPCANQCWPASLLADISMSIEGMLDGSSTVESPSTDGTNNVEIVGNAIDSSAVCALCFVWLESIHLLAQVNPSFDGAA